MEFQSVMPLGIRNTFSQSKIFLGVSLTLGLFFFCSTKAFGQPSPANTNISGENAGEFIDLGYISFSPKYTLADNAKNIMFKIRNNTTRSIANIYAWIYEVTKDNNKRVPVYRLLNNPNNGGILVKGGAHRPGTVVDWRFLLVSADKNNINGEYTLWVNHRGVFFTKMEPFKEKVQ